MSVVLVESHEFIEGVLADHIRVKDEEQAAFVVGSKDLLSQLERSCSSKGLTL